MARILVDYDQTLADTQTAMNNAMNTVFGKTFSLDGITSWINDGYFTDEENEYRWGAQCFLNEKLQSNVKPVVGAIEGMFHLLESGHRPMVVSDRPTELFEVTRDWLDNQGLDMVRLLFTRHKHSQSQDSDKMTKYQAAWAHRLEYVIEDAPHHVTKFADKPYIKRVFLLDYPYNRVHAVPPHEKIERVSFWDDIPCQTLPL